MRRATKVLLAHILFCASGWLGSPVNTYLADHGVEGPGGLIQALGWYVGMMLAAVPSVAAVRRRHGDEGVRYYRRYADPQVALLAAVDIGAVAASMLAIEWVGAGLYVALYASITVFCAFERWLLLHRPLNGPQWAGVALVFGGVALTVATVHGDDGTQLAPGVVMSLVSALLYSFDYILVEKILSAPHTDRTPDHLCFVIGTAGFCVVGAVNAVWVGSQWREQVADPVAEKNGGRWHGLLMLWLLYAASTYVHMASFYYVTAKSPGGAVASAINKGVQTVTIFIESHLLFCSDRPSQCVDVYKAWAIENVVLGALIYAYGTNLARRVHERRKTHEDGIPPELNVPPTPPPEEEEAWVAQDRGRFGHRECESQLDDLGQHYEIPVHIRGPPPKAAPAPQAAGPRGNPAESPTQYNAIQ